MRKNLQGNKNIYFYGTFNVNNNFGCFTPKVFFQIHQSISLQVAVFREVNEDSGFEITMQNDNR